MLAGTFVERVEETAAENSEIATSCARLADECVRPTQAEESDTDFDPGNFSFDFGAGDRRTSTGRRERPSLHPRRVRLSKVSRARRGGEYG